MFIYIFYLGVPMYHFTHVPGPVAKYSVVSEYNVSCTPGMNLENFRMLNNELVNKDPEVVSEHETLIKLDIKSSVCMDNNGKDTKHIIHISIIMHLVRNSEE